MIELVKILKQKSFDSTDYNGGVFTVFVDSDRYYKITLDYHSEAVSYDAETNYWDGGCTIEIEQILKCDDVAETWEPMSLESVHEVSNELENNYWREFE